MIVNILMNGNMQGRTIIAKNVGNSFWTVDSKRKNSKGKKPSWAKAEAKKASRKIRRMLKNVNEE